MQTRKASEFFVTDWTSNHAHFASLVDAISYARGLNVNAIVHGRNGEILWLHEPTFTSRAAVRRACGLD